MWHHQSQFCLCGSPLVSLLRWTVSHRALFDLGETSVYVVCDGLLYHHHHIIIYVNISDILMFFLFSVFQIYSVWFHLSIYVNGTQII